MTPEEQAQVEGMAPFWQLLRMTKGYVDTAPTYTPKNLLDQVVLYKNGATYRVYVWYGVTEGWHYVALT